MKNFSKLEHTFSRHIIDRQGQANAIYNLRAMVKLNNPKNGQIKNIYFANKTL